MKVVIDRFEGTYAICERENRQTINIEKKKIPSDAKEGDVLLIEKDLIKIDVIETEKRKNLAKKTINDLWE